MKRTIIVTAVLVALVFVASLLEPRGVAQTGVPRISSFVYGQYKVERLESGGTCVLIVTKLGLDGGGDFSVASC